VGRGNLVFSPAHGTGHCQQGTFIGQPDKLVLADILADPFLDCLRPPADVEEHL